MSNTQIKMMTKQTKVEIEEERTAEETAERTESAANFVIELETDESGKGRASFEVEEEKKTQEETK